MDIKEATQGRWPEIFLALGVRVGSSGRHCPCPICGPGKDGTRYRFDDKEGKGTWICNHCGAGDGFSLVMKVLGVNFRGAVKAIEGVIGLAGISKLQPEAKVSKKLLRKIYEESAPVIKSDPVGKYLKSRGLKVISKKLRYHPACYEPETHTKMVAMLGTFQLSDGEAITMHRTFLTKKGEKANIQKVKKLLPGLKKMSGGAIRLFEPEAGLIAIAEGIETALAVTQMSDIPCWAAVSSGLMETFEPPKGITRVEIFADRDKNFAGQKSAYILANRLVIKYRIEVDVHIPKRYGDFLDELNAGASRQKGE